MVYSNCRRGPVLFGGSAFLSWGAFNWYTTRGAKPMTLAIPVGIIITVIHNINSTHLSYSNSFQPRLSTTKEPCHPAGSCLSSFMNQIFDFLCRICLHFGNRRKDFHYSGGVHLRMHLDSSSRAGMSRECPETNHVCTPLRQK
jgi:hypothetical protein